MKKWMMMAGVLAAAISAQASRDVLTAAADGEAKLAGPAGEKLERFFAHRILGDFAKETVFPEARQAFVDRDDDLFGPFPPGYPRRFGMWKGEFWGKLMISASRIAKYEHDEQLKTWLHEEALRLIATQDADGYLGTYRDRDYIQSMDMDEMKTNSCIKGAWNWNLWGRKYTIWGLLMNYELNGDPVVLKAAERSMDHILSQLKAKQLRFSDTGTFHGVPSMSILKPLLKLYQLTKKPEYFERAKEIVDDCRRADGRHPNLIANAFSERPLGDWYPQPWQWAKVYENLSLADGLLEWYRLTGEAGVLEAMKRLQAKLNEHELNPMFSVGYNDQFANAARQLNGVSEPCDVIHWIRFNYDLYLLTGEPKYVDAMELGFFNTYLAAIYRNGQWGARGVRSHTFHHAILNGQSGMKHQHCCVNNLPRTACDIASVTAAKDAAGTLYVAFYNDATAEVGGDRVEISGGYPFRDEILVKLNKRTAGKVRFRVPAWSARDLDRGTWREFDAPAGESEYRLVFDLSPRLYDPMRRPMTYQPIAYDFQDEDEPFKRDWLTRMWMNYSDDYSLANLMRTTPAATIMRGPLLLAKARVAGTEQSQIESVVTVHGTRPQLALKPLPAEDSIARWMLTIGEGKLSVTVPVCDYPSAGDKYEFGQYGFSIWF